MQLEMKFGAISLCVLAQKPRQRLRETALRYDFLRKRSPIFIYLSENDFITAVKINDVPIELKGT